MKKKATRIMATLMTGVLLVQLTAVYTEDAEASGNTKEETVYVKTDASGVPEEVIVSDWLKNTDSAALLEDVSDLENIENVKGEETYTQDGDKLIWSADGSDIYYQGTTEKELPVSVSVAYYLDGTKLEPEELAGKSGHVRICYTYENRSKTTEAYTPFVMVTGIVLPTEDFENIEVSNARLISDGEKDIVIGMGFPGLSESLQLDELELPGDIGIPESFELEADVTDFSLTMSMTVATVLDLDEWGLDDVDSMDDLMASIDELTDAAGQLTDGTGELTEGVQTLKDSCVELIDGMDAIDDGMGDLADGIDTLNSRKGELISGIYALASGIQTLENSKGALISGVGELASGSSTLRSGAEELKEGSSQLAQSSQLLEAGAQELANGEGSVQLQAGAKALVAGSEQLQAGTETLSAGIDALLSGTGSGQLLNGSAELAQGSAELESGIAGYTAGAETLAAGTAAYIGSVGAYVQAVNSALTAMMQDQPESHAQGEDGAAQYAETETRTVLTIDESAVADMQSVLACLKEVQAAIDGATTTEERMQLYASYDYYVAELNTCITQMSSALNSVQEETVTSAVAAQEGEDGNADDPARAGYLAQLAQAGASLTPDGNEEVRQLLAGAQALTAADGTKGTPGDLLNAGAASVADGAAALEDGISQVFLAVQSELKPGIEALVSGTASLASGIRALDTGVEQLLAGAGTLAEHLAELGEGADALAGGNASLYDGTVALEDGAGKLYSGAAALSGGIGQLAAGGSQLCSGAYTLGSGIEALADGGAQLKDGTAELAGGGEALDEGVEELLEGAKELQDGMEEFNEEGIQRIADFFEEDVQEILDRLEAVRAAADAYKLFSESGTDTDGSVKFIIETGSIG